MACKHVSTCPLVRIFAGKSSLRIWSAKYCEGDPASCARHRFASYGEPVPDTLLPNGQSLELPGAAEADARC
jgi:hypothetical protein